MNQTRNNVKELEELARDMVGDGKIPNLFFVSFHTRGVVMVSRDFLIAYQFWHDLAYIHQNVESMLEDRRYGVIASREPEKDEKDTKLVIRDDKDTFLKQYPRFKKPVF